MNEGSLSPEPHGSGATNTGLAEQRPVRLRQAREAAGLHLTALAMALKVPVKKLEALEAGRYEELPDLTFARALASSACRHLKIDPASVLQQIPAAHQPVLGPPDAMEETRFNPGAALGTSSIGLAWLKRPAVVISVVALLAAAIVAWAPLPTQWPVDTWLERWFAPQPAESAAQLPPRSGLPASNIGELEFSPNSANAISPEVAEPMGLDTVVAVESATADGSGVPAGVLLVLTARSESWIEVIDGKGKLQVQRVFKAGERLDFAANPPYSVVLGRADAVQVQVRGQPFDVAPFARNSVARFEVK